MKLFQILLCLLFSSALFAQQAAPPEGFVPVADSEDFVSQIRQIEVINSRRDIPLVESALELAAQAAIASNADSGVRLTGEMLHEMGITGSNGQDFVYIWGGHPGMPLQGMSWEYVNPSASYIEVMSPEKLQQQSPGYWESVHKQPGFSALGEPILAAYIHLEVLDALNRQYPYYLVLFLNEVEGFIFFPILRFRAEPGTRFPFNEKAKPEEVRELEEQLNSASREAYENSPRQQAITERFSGAQRRFSLGNMLLIGGGAALVLFAAIAFFRRK